MAIFFHVDVRGEIKAGDMLTTMPVKSSSYPEDAVELNRMFPQGLSYFGATIMLHMGHEGSDTVIEQILETIRREFRQKCGVDYPSRMTSLFACRDLQSTRQFRDRFQRKDGRIWEVECDDYFKGDMDFVCHELTEDHNLAVYYWQSRQKSVKPFWEYLLRPPVKVIREISD